MTQQSDKHDDALTPMTRELELALEAAARWKDEPMSSFAPNRTLGLLSRALLKLREHVAVSHALPTGDKPIAYYNAANMTFHRKGEITEEQRQRYVPLYEFPPSALSSEAPTINALAPGERSSGEIAGYRNDDARSVAQTRPTSQERAQIPSSAPLSSIEPQGRIPELESTRQNAEYWKQSAFLADDRSTAVTCMAQAVNAWKNAAYAAHDRLAAPSATRHSREEAYRRAFVLLLAEVLASGWFHADPQMKTRVIAYLHTCKLGEEHFTVEKVLHDAMGIPTNAERAFVAPTDGTATPK